jgi:hypothetical protein
MKVIYNVQQGPVERKEIHIFSSPKRPVTHGKLVMQFSWGLNGRRLMNFNGVFFLNKAPRNARFGATKTTSHSRAAQSGDRPLQVLRQSGRGQEGADV